MTWTNVRRQDVNASRHLGGGGIRTHEAPKDLAVFGGPANEPPIREPSPAHIAAQEAYIAADRERTKALGEVVRLEDELSRGADQHKRGHRAPGAAQSGS